ncbi:MAG TPA: NADP-dependent oxidoreductase [Kofleriaceae bacterium]
MRAIVQRSFGAPEVLEVTEVDRPTPLPSEIVVRVQAIGLNPVEAIVRAGVFPLIGQPPFILGWDVSGVVEEVVPGVNRFRRGDEVFGMPFFPRAANAYAEYVAAPSRQFARKPAKIDHVHAAALPLAGLTAWQSLIDTADLQAGQRILIHGAAGGVGHLAVQIAKSRGAYVIGTASAGKHEFVRGLGADEMIDYRAVDFAERVRDVDVVFEVIGGDYAMRSVRVLKPGGLLITAVERSNAALAAAVEKAGRRFAGITVEPDQVGLEAMARLVDAGRLKIHVDRVFPMTEIAAAHALLEAGHLKGKLVVTV